jgi:hypothetical protein
MILQIETGRAVAFFNGRYPLYSLVASGDRNSPATTAR